MTDEQTTTVDSLLQEIVVKAGVIQLEADSKEHNLDWKKIHELGQDIAIAVWSARKQLGFHDHENQLIDLTMMLDEHPEGWEGPCMCKMCLEYAQ